MLRKIERAVKILRETGMAGVACAVRRKCGIPLPISTKTQWKAHIPTEVQFWDDYFRATIAPMGKDSPRLRPEEPLHRRAGELLPEDRESVHILDVGAGPLTFLGKVYPGKTIRITAVDPLAHFYDRILEKYSLTPLVRTEPGDAEKLSDSLPPDTYDLVYARNCIDHSYDAEKAVVEMLKVVKPGCYVLMEHHPNEAEHAHYAGLHQWNFSMDEAGHFMIRSEKKGVVDMTEKYRGTCSITCETIDDGEPWLITRIHRHMSQHPPA